MKKIVLLTAAIAFLIVSCSFCYFYENHSFDNNDVLKKKIKQIDIDISNKDKKIEELNKEIEEEKIKNSEEVKRYELWEKELKNLKDCF